MTAGQRTVQIPRIMIAGANSGCGKTTVTCALLRYFANSGIKVKSFKCGPDYIDPMFHEKAIGVDSGNLDMFLTGEQGMKHMIATYAAGYDIAVMEGVMGLYDGTGINSGEASSNHISLLTDTPVVLVVNGKGMSLSIAAVVKGFMDYGKNNIVGVILNRVSEKIYVTMKEILQKEFSVAVLGYLPERKDITIDSRHLGLVTANEIHHLNDLLDNLAAQAAATIDIKRLFAIAKNYAQYAWRPIPLPKRKKQVKIAVAKDEAFCFYYKESLDLLRKLGTEIHYFSPLRDSDLPDGASGVILGGGYPELYLEQLSQNAAMRESIRNAIRSRMPCIAECGGYMYLLNNIGGYPMAGAIEGSAELTGKLVRFGYVTLEALEDTMLCEKGGKLNAHEFHYSDADNLGASYLAVKKRNGVSYPSVHGENALFAGYPHLHLWGNITAAVRFLDACAAYAGV